MNHAHHIPPLEYLRQDFINFNPCRTHKVAKIHPLAFLLFALLLVTSAPFLINIESRKGKWIKYNRALI